MQACNIPEGGVAGLTSTYCRSRPPRPLESLFWQIRRIRNSKSASEKNWGWLERLGALLKKQILAAACDFLCDLPVALHHVVAYVDRKEGLPRILLEPFLKYFPGVIEAPRCG